MPITTAPTTIPQTTNPFATYYQTNYINEIKNNMSPINDSLKDTRFHITDNQMRLNNLIGRTNDLMTTLKVAYGISQKQQKQKLKLKLKQNFHLLL